MSLDPADTIIIGPDGVEQSPAASTKADATATHSHVDVRHRHSSGDLAARFEEGTQRLLRWRLLVVGATLVSIMTVLTIMTVINGQFLPAGFGLRLLTTGLLLVVTIFLQRSGRPSVAALRRVEVLIMAVPMTEMVLLQIFRTEVSLESGDLVTIPAYRASIGIASCVLIAMYGIFIPSTWQRTAVITTTAAILPTATALIHIQMYEQLQNMLPYNYVIPTLTLSMAGIATLGAHIVSSLRHDVVAARHYGQYHLADELGRGSMGIVYKAEHRMLKRPAAIKLIHAESAADRESVARFEQEVQLSATLTHWNTVRIFDYGRTDHGDFYYVMELLDGQTLENRLAAENHLDVVETLKIVLQICDGLQEAHEKGMVHRDLKPANVFLANTGGRQGVVKILDFGLATRYASDEEVQNANLCGTPSYMSPEQIRGELVEPASDIYSIGCLMYQCLTGIVPCRGETISEVFDQHLNGTIPLDSLSVFGSEIRSLVERCLEKQAEDRIPDVHTLRKTCRLALRHLENPEQSGSLS